MCRAKILHQIWLEQQRNKLPGKLNKSSRLADAVTQLAQYAVMTVQRLLREVSFKSSMLRLVILLLMTRCSKSESEELFYRADIRLSKFEEFTSIGYCSSREECTFKCFINTDCYSVRLFPLEGVFFTEHLSIETAPYKNRRVYEDLNSK